MTRLILIIGFTAFLVLSLLGLYYLKDAYKILPISASKEFDMGHFADWREFKAASGNFSVMFPTVPQHATQTMKDPKTKLPRFYDMYVAEKSNGSIFMVSLIRFEDQLTPEILQKTVINDLLAANPQNQLKDMRVGTYKEFPNVEFAITNEAMRINGMIFVDKDVLYLLSAVFNNRSYSQEDYNFFLNSFDLKTSKLGK